VLTLDEARRVALNIAKLLGLEMVSQQETTMTDSKLDALAAEVKKLQR
jgi:hypothetical protein